MSDSDKLSSDASTGGGESDAAARETTGIIEAILFASDSPLTAAKIAQVADLPQQRSVKDAIEQLNGRYAGCGCAFRVEQVGGGYQMLTLPQYHDVLARALRTRAETKLSQAALETLSIVAYRQPILRADVEAIRGVSCGEVLRGLLEKQLVKIVGRAEVLGRPMLYGTTRRFLEVFGLGDLEDLPKAHQLRRPGDQKPTKTKTIPKPQSQGEQADPQTPPPEAG